MMNSQVEPTRLKVSFTARLLAAVAYTIPLIGGAVSSFFMIGVLQALKNSENAGIGVVMEATNEASLPVIVSLYFAAFLGFVVVAVLVVRMMVQTKTASPPFWFFVLGGVLCFLPAGLFWSAKLLVLEALSPGSSIAAGGISGVATELNVLLFASIIAAPCAFIVLTIASVVPFSSTPRPKVLSLITATGVTLLLVATAIGIPFLIDGPTRKKDIVDLPINVKAANSDYDIVTGTAVVISLAADNKLYQTITREVNGKTERADVVVSQDELTAKIVSAMEGKSPDKRIVYFKCDVNASYDNVLQVFDAVRKSDVDKIGLVVIGSKNNGDPYQVQPLSLEVRLQEPSGWKIAVPSGPPVLTKDKVASRTVDLREEIINDAVSPRPNPLILVAALDGDGKLRLNNEDMGTLTDTKQLETMLTRVFKERENNGVYRERTNEVEKMVYIKASKATKYGDFIKLVEAVKGSGAQPIGIQFDDVILTMGSS